MATPARDKYYLKSLHDEIDLFDRKLAHLRKYDSFASDAERDASAGKMANKRELLVKTARQLVSEGIEFKPSELPRSLRTAEETAAGATHGVAMPAAQAENTPLAAHIAPVTKHSPSPFAGTVLDGRASIEAYKRARSKPSLSQA